MRGCDARHHALMPCFAERAIEIEARHTLHRHAFLARELQHRFQTIDVRGLQNRDRLNLPFTGAQSFEHGVDAVDDVLLRWTMWFGSFAIVLMWASSRHQSSE